MLVAPIPRILHAQVERTESPFLLGIKSPGTEVGKLLYNLQYIDIDGKDWCFVQCPGSSHFSSSVLEIFNSHATVKITDVTFPPFLMSDVNIT